MVIVAFIPKIFLSVMELHSLIFVVQQDASILLTFMLYDSTHFPICYKRLELGWNKGFNSLDILIHKDSKDC